MDANPPISKAMVLAAGLGTRMRPITDKIPKPLVNVAGKSLLDHALDALAQADVKQAAVNVHYLADQIESHVEARVEPQVIISNERAELLDSGGGVKHAISSFGSSDFYILNADSFWMDGAVPNLSKMNSVWNGDDMDMLLLVSSKEQAVGFDGAGDFFMDDSGRLTRRGEANSAPFIYAGAIVAKTDQFHSVEEAKFSLNQLFDDAVSTGRLYGCALDGLWLHVGTPDAIGEAEDAIAAYETERA